jgi:hypothetical protein
MYDNGTHYVTNQRLTLEVLEEISGYQYVVEVTGGYTRGNLTFPTVISIQYSSLSMANGGEQ